jgi:ribosomal protein S18 acetylase RimI-like enzyme
MRLNVLPGSDALDVTRVLAMADQAYADFCAAGTTSESIDIGIAICTPQFPEIHDANRLFLARHPADADVEQLWEATERYYAERRSRCRRVMLSRLAKDSEKQPLAELLLSRGWRELCLDLLRLDHSTGPRDQLIRIVSARSVMRLYESFARQAAMPVHPQLADVSILRLDEPRYEALVALVDGQVVARAAVMTSGEVGLIEQVHVLEAYRGRGIGRAVMQAAVDLCARAEFKHVVLSCAAENAVAQALYASMGFVKIGESVSLADPDTLA